MNVQCPKCGEPIYADASVLYDEFIYDTDVCQTCGANIAYNSSGSVLFTSIHEPIAVAIDVILRDINDHVLFVKRKFQPHIGKWALPGGFVNQHETCEAAAVREVFEETGIKIIKSMLRMVTVLSDPGRDSRGRVISIVYAYDYVIDKQPQAAGDAEDAKFFNLFDGSIKQSMIAFDHNIPIFMEVVAQNIKNCST